MKELIFNELDKYTKANLSNKPEKNKWQRISYTADGQKGTMLAVGENSFPKPIEIDLKVKGFYKIYVCLGQISSNSLIEISLSKDKGKTVLMPSHLFSNKGYGRWGIYEYAEEGFFRIADLTNQKIIINKPTKFQGPVQQVSISCALLYIRLEPISQTEIKKIEKSHTNKTVQYHFDCDYYGECDYKNADDYLGRLNMLKYGNVDSVIFEPTYDVSNLRYSKKAHYQSCRIGYAKSCYGFLKHIDKFYDKASEKVHGYGGEAYLGYRIELGDFSFPFYHLDDKHGLQNVYKDFHAELRSGKLANFLSFAYKEAREMAIKRIIDVLPSSFDGVSLFFHRGIFVLFEQPVRDKVMKDYGVDARRLPFSDYRLHNVLCYFVNEFLKELRVALDKKSNGKKRYKINAIVYYDIDSSKNFGMDVETWAKEGLVDSVSQGLMTIYEDLDGLLDKNGFIDLKKYNKKVQTDVIVKRTFDDKEEHIIGGVKKLKKVCDKYGVKFYGALPWEHLPYEFQIAMAKKLYEAGVDNFLSWNSNHIAKKMPVISAVRELGDKKAVLSDSVKVFRRVLRITEINGNDISECDVNWKG